MHNHKDTVSMDASGAQWDVFIAYYGDDRNGTQKQSSESLQCTDNKHFTD